MNNVEIERRWITNMDPGFTDTDWIETCYIKSDIGNIRYRKKHKDDGTVNCYQTIKKGSGISRKEYEVKIPLEMYDEVVDGLKLKVFYKAVPIKDTEYIMEFKKMGDYIAMEIEFKSEEEALNFNIENYINGFEFKDETDNPYYLFNNWYKREKEKLK